MREFDWDGKTIPAALEPDEWLYAEYRELESVIGKRAIAGLDRADTHAAILLVSVSRALSVPMAQVYRDMTMSRYRAAIDALRSPEPAPEAPAQDPGVVLSPTQGDASEGRQESPVESNG